MHYYKTFVDECNVYFLLEYIKGIEFFDALREIGKNLNFLNSFFLLNFKIYKINNKYYL